MVFDSSLTTLLPYYYTDASNQTERMVEQRVAVPDVIITSSAVETWGEPQIAAGDTATATVTFQVNYTTTNNYSTQLLDSV
jgi:hypothetical protein